MKNQSNQLLSYSTLPYPDPWRFSEYGISQIQKKLPGGIGLLLSWQHWMEKFTRKPPFSTVNFSILQWKKNGGRNPIYCRKPPFSLEDGQFHCRKWWFPLVFSQNQSINLGKCPTFLGLPPQRHGLSESTTGDSFYRIFGGLSVYLDHCWSFIL
jgi:hypothetical protein